MKKLFDFNRMLNEGDIFSLCENNNKDGTHSKSNNRVMQSD